MRRRLVALAAVAAATVVPLPVAAQQAGDAPADSLVLASQTPWVAPDGTFAMRVSVERDGRPVRTEDAAGLEVQVTVHDRVRSRSAFQLTLQDQSLPRSLTTFTIPLGQLAPDRTGIVPLSLPLRDGQDPDDPAGLRIVEAGVYPVQVELRSGAGTVDTLVTHLLRLPPEREDAAPLDVALVLPVGTDPALQPAGDIDLDRDDLRRVTTVVDALEEHRDVAASVAPTPETLDALGAPTTGGPGQDVLTSLRRSLGERQLLGGPYVDIDVTAFVVAGLDTELAAQFTRGREVTAELLRARPDGRTYVADGSATPAALGRLAELGIDQVVVPEESLEPIDLVTTLTRPFELQGPSGRTLRAASADTALAAHFTTEDAVLGAHQLLADLAVLFFDLPGRDQRGVTVLPPDAWEPSAAFLDTLLTGLGRTSVLGPVTIDDLFRDVPVELQEDQPLVRQLRPPESTDDLAATADTTRLTRLRLTGFDAMTQPTNPRFERWERHLLVSQAVDLDEAGRRGYLDAVDDVLDAELAAIRVPLRQTITLTSREADVPLSFRNDTGYPVTVRIRLDSDQLEFPEGDSEEVVLSEVNTTVTFPVRARTSGAFPLRLEVASPGCCLQVANTRLTVRSTAVSGVAAFLSIGAGAFLLGWWLLHFRKARRDRRLVGRSPVAGHQA